jgi:hypothetical protein
MMVKGQRLKAAGLGLLECSIWGLVISTIIGTLGDNLFLLAFYCLGYATGLFLGSTLEGKIALGTSSLQLIANDENTKKIIDYLKANERGYTVYSDFLGLSEISELCAVRFSVPVTLWGGYEDAERCVVCFGDREYFNDNTDYPIKCILIKPVNQKFADNLTHRDFLGSLMGLGIRREVLGDIIISENCGYLFCLDAIADYIIENLTQVRHTTVKCELTENIPTDALSQAENREIIRKETIQQKRCRDTQQRYPANQGNLIARNPEESSGNNGCQVQQPAHSP